MPINIKDAALQNLKRILSEDLKLIKVEDGNIVDDEILKVFDNLKDTLPKHGATKEELERYIIDKPVPYFFFSEIVNKVFDICGHEKGKNHSLMDLPYYKDTDVAADNLADELKSLPWRYTYIFELPEDLSQIFCENEEGAVKVSEFVRIGRGSKIFQNQYKPLSGIRNRDDFISRLITGKKINNENPSIIWSPEKAYLLVDVEGYVDRYEQAEPHHLAVSIMRSFFGLGIALHLFDIDESLSKMANIDSWMYVYKQEAQGDVLTYTFPLEPHHNQGIKHLVLFKGFEAKPMEGKLLWYWILSQINRIGKALNARETQGQISLAGQWFFDSYTGSDQFLQFVQGTIVLEILLGDKEASEAISLSELMSNRCAYLISHSHEERIEFAKQFKQIYNVRSKIVHRGKSRLLTDEKTIFDKLRWISKRVIYEEIMLLGGYDPLAADSLKIKMDFLNEPDK